MKAFSFRLDTLLHLREMAKDQAIKEYALAIKDRENAEQDLKNAVESLEGLNLEINQKRMVGFSGFEQDAFNQSILRTKELIIDFNSKLADSKNIEVAKRLLKMKEKKKDEDLKREEKKEETELEDVIGARYVFNQTIY